MIVKSLRPVSFSDGKLSKNMHNVDKNNGVVKVSAPKKMDSEIPYIWKSFPYFHILFATWWWVPAVQHHDCFEQSARKDTVIAFTCFVQMRSELLFPCLGCFLSYNRPLTTLAVHVSDNAKSTQLGHTFRFSFKIKCELSTLFGMLW